MAVERSGSIGKMRSPPTSSEGLFLSSPRHYLGYGPEDEVDSLFATARKVERLHDNLAAVVNDNKAIFLDVFGRQVQLLKSRSQAFEDAHITVYDKVLLLLTSNGNNLESPAAITWYCAEYLGVNLDGQVEHVAQSFHGGIEVPHLVTQGLHLPDFQYVSKAKAVQAMTPLSSRKNSEPATNNETQGASKPSKPATSQEDPVFARLWSVYAKAHQEYLNAADRNDNGTIEAAKFLRDTAENGIFFLKDKFPKDPAMAELTDTYNMAKSVVLKLNGGRKRKFDPHTWADKDLDRKAYTPHKAEHDRNSYRVRKHANSKRERKPRGRGPSGIPYGYSRPVDSWYPE